MLDLTELQQLVVLADCKTLSKAAEQLHISQPTLTRTMQHLEEIFAVPLFHREKNKITLNKTGEVAVECAKKLLAEAGHSIQQVRTFDKSLHTITVESCAPAPLWSFLPSLAGHYPDMTISSSINEIPDIINHVRSGSCDVGILPWACNEPDLHCEPFLKECLSVCALPEHSLAGNKTLTFTQMNGFNFLLRSEIGFWDNMCREKMPSSKFLVQTDDFAFQELINESSLPCFTTNLAQDTAKLPKNRQIIPITDTEANVTYHLIYLKNRQKK